MKAKDIETQINKLKKSIDRFGDSDGSRGKKLAELRKQLEAKMGPARPAGNR